MKTRIAGFLMLACLALDAAGQAPQITRQLWPEQTLMPGGAFGTTALLTGASSVTVQWTKDGAPYTPSGNTTTGVVTAVTSVISVSLGITGITPADAGTYVFTATSAGGSVSSRPIKINVTTDPGVAYTRVIPGLVFVNGGADQTTLVAQATGTGPFTYQWYRDMEPIPGATGSTYVLDHAASRSGVAYHCLVRNALGASVSSSARVVTGLPPAAPPSITSQPASPGTVPLGGSFTLRVGAAASPGMPVSYAWFRNGRLVPGMLPELTVSNVQFSDAGNYHVLVGNAVGGVQSVTVHVDVSSSAPAQGDANPAEFLEVRAGGQPGRIAALSTRSPVAAGAEPVISGFVIAGAAPKTVLIRAVGPALAGHGVTGALENPRLILYRGSEVIGTNDDWESDGSGSGAAAAAAFTGAAPFATGSRDAAMVVSLDPGVYTVHVQNAGGRDGIALAEVWDATVGAGAEGGSRIAGMSTRARSGSGEQMLIAGLVVAGDSPHRLLLRAVGPGLAQQNVPSPMANPLIELYRGSILLGRNDDWSTPLALEGPLSPPLPSGDPAIVAANAATGAAALVAGSRDSAMVVTLEPGAYTAVVRPASGDEGGNAMVEAYELPSTVPTAPAISQGPAGGP